MNLTFKSSNSIGIARIVLAVFLAVFIVLLPAASAYADGDSDYGSVGGDEYDSYDYGSVGGYDDSSSYDYGSVGGDEADSYDYGSVGGYSPDTYDYGSTGGYEADSYDYGSVGGYDESPSYESYSSPSYSDSYEAPSVSYASYAAPTASYASYTTGASYAAPVYTQPAPCNCNSVVYQQPPVVYTPPVYTPPVYTPPVVVTPPVYNTLQASCYAQNTNVNVGQSVTWVVNASGGNGSYSYTWGGQNLNGYSGQSVSTSYNSPGNETATVSVFSNGQTINVNCGSIVVNQYQILTPGITASCYANVASAIVGTPVTWTAVVNGGNGNYSYSWLDNNGVSTESSNGPTFTTTYPIAGSKAPRLTVSSLGSYAGYGYNGNNNSITVTCQPIGVNSGYNAGYTYTYPTTPSGSLATLSSVSLNQVPYTGLADSAGFWEFMVGLLLASLAGTWYFMKVYARGKRRYMINLFKKNNLAQKLVA